MSDMRIILVIVLSVLGISAYAGNMHVTVRGRITDDSGRPVSGVQITDGYTIVSTGKNGRYELQTTSVADYVYYTLPAGYSHSTYDRCIPVFYRALDKSTASQKIDFSLVRNTMDMNRHRLLMVADPQVLHMEELQFLDKVVDDMGKVAAVSDVPVIAMSAGDNVFDRPELIGPYKDCISSLEIPFYHALGNHDMDYNGRSSYRSDSTYCANFGPSHYSFNVGRIHYVVLNDVFYYGDTFLYIGYITEKQLSWLERDLSYVPEGSTVIVSLHIPTMYGNGPSAEGVSLMRNAVMNNKALYRILDGYNVHIMSGHSHMQWNTRISENIMEHTHAAACGAWWQGDVAVDGTPIGYTVYDIDGEDVSWRFRGVGLDWDEQFRMYRQGDTVIVNVFNYDEEWKVELYEDGINRGQMEQYWGYDPYARSIYSESKVKISWIRPGLTRHLFRKKVAGPDSSVKVVVTDRFGRVYEKSLAKLY